VSKAWTYCKFGRTLSLACILLLAVDCMGQTRRRLCGECFAPGDPRWKYCTRCGGVLVNLSRPEPRPPRLLHGGRKYDLRYRPEKGETLTFRINSVFEFSGPASVLSIPAKRQLDVELVQSIAEKTGEGFQFEMRRRLRGLIEEKKDITAEHAESFGNMKIKAYATDKGGIVAGSVVAEGVERPEDILAQVIIPLPKKSVARKDAWLATGVLAAGGCNALLPRELRSPTARASGRFVLADLVSRRKETCARLVGHFTIHATKRITLAEKDAALDSKAEFEYVAYFAVSKGYIVEVEATGYLATTVSVGKNTSTVTGKIRHWTQVRRQPQR